MALRKMEVDRSLLQVAMSQQYWDGAQVCARFEQVGLDDRSLETRRLPDSSPMEAEAALSWVAGVARVGRNEITAL